MSHLSVQEGFRGGSIVSDIDHSLSGISHDVENVVTRSILFLSLSCNLVHVHIAVQVSVGQHVSTLNLIFHRVQFSLLYFHYL